MMSPQQFNIYMMDSYMREMNDGEENGGVNLENDKYGPILGSRPICKL